MDVGLLLLRAVVGLLLAGHGAQKLFGWYGGHGLQGTAGFLESLGWRPGRAFAVILGGLELAGGLALALGLLTPLAAGALAAVLASAAWFVHRRNGLWNQGGGVELPMVLAVAALALGFIGAGRFSLDHLLGWSLRGASWGLWTLTIMLAGWLAAAAARRLPARERSGTTVGQAA